MGGWGDGWVMGRHVDVLVMVPGKTYLRVVVVEPANVVRVRVRMGVHDCNKTRRGQCDGVSVTQSKQHGKEVVHSSGM